MSDLVKGCNGLGTISELHSKTDARSCYGVLDLEDRSFEFYQVLK